MTTLGLSIAIVSLTISAIALYRTRLYEERRRELEVSNYINNVYQDLRSWAEESTEKLTCAAFLCELDPTKMPNGDFFQRRHSIRVALSSLLDRGRFYIPNERADTVGLHKPSAYRGLRQEALDHLCEGYDLVCSIHYLDSSKNSEKRTKLVDAKKRFVAEIQDTLDVHRMMGSIQALSEELTD